QEGIDVRSQNGCRCRAIGRWKRSASSRARASAIVMTIVPRDLNIVLQRPEPLAPNERFDLIVATNILIYYDVFEQSLALSNVARMLRRGGFVLSNDNPTIILPTTQMDVVGFTHVVYTDQPND